MKKFYICKCFYTDNIFVKALKCHVCFDGKPTFLRRYQQVLRDNGVVQEKDKDAVISKIESEIQRRKNLGKDHVARQQIIEKRYKQLHPQIFSLKEEYLDPEFLNLAAYVKQPDAVFEEAFDYLQQTDIQRTYTVKVFTDKFCKLFLEEIKQFESSDCPKGRPNTMNRYGVMLEELGFDRFITDLRENYLQEICGLLFPDWVGSGLDSHKAFIVQYNEEGDTDLSCHYDNSEVTLNVALSPDTDYEGGDLFFSSMRTESIQTRRQTQGHTTTLGLIHRGQHMHGASAITHGDRYNLIIWMRASSVRNKKCPMCDQVPDLVEVEGCGDGFTAPEQTVVNVCSTT